MLKRIAAALVACVVTIVITSCSLIGGTGGNTSGGVSSDSSSEPVDINYPIDMDGVNIDKMPERVVSLSPALTEIICTLGYESRLVGRTDYCDYPESVSSLPAVGTPVMLDTDKIAALKPDLILLQAPPTNEALIKMQQTGAAIITIQRAFDVDSTGALYAKIFKIMEGAETGAAKGEEYAKSFVQRMASLTKSIQDSLSTAGDAPEYTAAYIIDTTSIAATSDTYESKLMGVIGLQNVTKDAINWNYSYEKLVEAKPYVLLCASGIDIKSLAANKRLKGMAAVKNERTYAVNTVIFERQSPRIADELERIAKEIYPDLQLGGTASSEQEEASSQESSLEQEASSK